MANESNGNGNGGLKTLAIILTICAVIGGLAAIVRPMQQNIDSNEASIRRDLVRVETDINHLKIYSSTESASKFSEIKVMFAEVETQFKWLREVMQGRIDGLIKRVESLEERIRQLEISGGKK